MNEKRSRQELSPASSPESAIITKKQNIGNMPADMSVKELSEMLAAKIDGLEVKLDGKIENLATKDDLRMFADEVQNLKESNETIKATLVELKADRDGYKTKFEQIERMIRRKNVIIKRCNLNGNVREAVNQLFNSKMQIQVDIDEVQVIGHRNGTANTVLVKFVREESVNRVFSEIRKLAGSGVIIERDYSEDVRKRMDMLLKVRKVVKSKLVEKRDKDKMIKVIGDRMMIENQRFHWQDGQLWCGTQLGYAKLNSIFKCQFNEFSFNLVDMHQ